MAADRPFWARWGRRRILGWLFGVTAFAGLTSFLAGIAQHAAVVAARPETAELLTYSLGGHVAAMTLLACAAVLVACSLLQLGHRVIAATVLAATAFGPMVVIAAPVGWSVVASSSMDTVWWWHVTVGAAVFAVLAAWTLAIRPLGEMRVDRPIRAIAMVSDEALFLAVASIAFVGCWNFAWQLQESPGALPALGWAALTAGVMLVFARGTWRRIAPVALLIGLALVVMRWSYLRDGGWPGVAGWEFNGMESPVILSPRVVLVTTLGPLVAILVRSGRQVFARRPRPDAPVEAAVLI